jgi:hypothetical protein
MMCLLNGETNLLAYLLVPYLLHKLDLRMNMAMMSV